MKRIAIIANPAAGNKELLQKVPWIRQQLLTKAQEVEILQTKKPGDGAEFVRNIADQVDMIISVGGDGTVHELINALCPLSHRPVFAVLPGGTCNDFSRALGISPIPEVAVNQILQQNIRQVDVGKHDEQYFLNFWGIGLITQVSEQIQPDIKKDWGRLAYYLSAVETIASPKTFYLEVESESNYFQGEACMMIVGNGSYVGGMETYFPSSQVQDGQLDVLIIRKASIESFFSMITSHLCEERPESEHLLYFQASSLTVKTDPIQTVDCDGEKHTSTPTQLSILPKHLKMIVGDSFDERSLQADSPIDLFRV
jgi:diacylglycerol kinase (ATP)